jgi:hypothetical protein
VKSAAASALASEETFTFAALPESLAEMKALPEASLTSPFATAALTVCALCVYAADKSIGTEMLNFLRGPRPLSNYDMVEQAADGRRVAKKTQESTPTGSTTVAITHTGSETTTGTTYQAGVDSTGDGVQTDKQVTKRDPSALSDTQTTSYAAGTKTTVTDQSQNDQSASADGYTLTGLDQATEHVLTRKGNIGVTTSQQMIMSELELRQTQMLRDYIGRFIRQTCYGLGVYPC